MSDDLPIRVFVSSTFRDMQAERDELVKRCSRCCAGAAKSAASRGARSTCAGA
ncbi:DUF4062 domain-containing protein [Micropruina glycogenica]|uniref:DUF4062 domain-containing protein n=1 Tax=Micropruina glycogenica TaxID=75385 RepID=UPI000CF695BB